MRIVRRYTNRKLYDMQEGYYTTLTGIAALIRAGEEIEVLHFKSESNSTNANLAQIICEEEREYPQLALALS
jgi:polyhydroxyalkanoate synthesis repressor PhaR